MNHPVTPHTTCPASHVRPVGTGEIRTRSHRKPIETPLQNRPCPRSKFTGKAPRKGKRIPLNKIKNNEQRDEETGYGYFLSGLGAALKWNNWYHNRTAGNFTRAALSTVAFGVGVFSPVGPGIAACLFVYGMFDVCVGDRVFNGW